MNLQDAIRMAVRELTPVVGDTARIDAEVLLMRVLNIDRAKLYSHLDSPLTPPQEQEFLEFVARREKYEPVAYIVGSREFFGLTFHVDRRVLIPRPETETLVERALATAKNIQGQPLIADVGVGSGAIAVSLAVNLADAVIYALDQSEGALEVTLKNAMLHHVSQRILLIRGNLLEPLPQPVDIITANLPYVRYSDLAGLQPDIINYEPLEALDGGPDGLDKIRELLIQVDGKLKKGGSLLLEIGAEQGQSVTELAQQTFPGATVNVIKDLAGLDRVVEVGLSSS